MINKITDLINEFFRAKTNMEKEISEQPDIIKKLIKKYIGGNGEIKIDLPDNITKIALIASGSSYHSATIAANYFRNNAYCEAQSFYASEFTLFAPESIDLNTLYIFISQSGETTDTNKALELVNKKTNKTLAITNTKHSNLYNNAKYKTEIFAGEEKAIASTKAMCAQIFCLYLIAGKLMQQKDMPINSLIDELKNIPKIIKSMFFNKDEIKNFANELVKYDNAAILASGMFYPLAKEGSLKIKETSYINTTAYPTGEFLHGHIAILNKKCAVISVVNNKNVEFTVNVLKKIQNEYNTDCLVISAFKLKSINKNNVISIDTSHDIEFLFGTLVLFQMLAFECAKLLKRNIDKPDGLTKVV